MHPLVLKFIRHSKDLADAVRFDESGAIVGRQYQGGNGGMLSRETLRKADLVHLDFNEIQKLISEQKEA